MMRGEIWRERPPAFGPFVRVGKQPATVTFSGRLPLLLLIPQGTTTTAVVVWWWTLCEMRDENEEEKGCALGDCRA